MVKPLSLILCSTTLAACQSELVPRAERATHSNVDARQPSETELSGTPSHSTALAEATVLWTQGLDGARFVGPVELIGDQNRDGLSDFAVVVAVDDNFGGSQRVHLVDAASGATMRVLRSHLVSLIGEGFFATAIDSVPDVDGDGEDELVAGECMHDPINWGPPFAAHVFSSRTGEPLQRWRRDPNEGFGWDARGIADVDFDGCGDVLVRTNGWSTSSVTCFSGRSGETLYECCVAGSSTWCVIDDADADGAQDFVADSYERGADVPVGLSLFSGRTGRRVWHRPSGDENRWLRGRGLSAGDRDGDGAGDLWLLEGCRFNRKCDGWSIVLVSGRDGREIVRGSVESSSEHEPLVRKFIDADGDGVEDLLLYCATSYFPNRGELRVVSAADGRVIERASAADVSALAADPASGVVIFAAGRELRALHWPELSVRR